MIGREAQGVDMQSARIIIRGDFIRHFLKAGISFPNFMNRTSDRAGPFFLFVLLAAAFIPSLLLEFDSSRLVSAIEEALGRLAIPIQFILADRDAPPAALPSSIGPARLVSIGYSASLASDMPPPGLVSRLPMMPGSGAYRWPPGSASSPRAPPRQA
jgi:hypothetical protein